MTPEAVEDAPRAFKKALIERALGTEMSHHMGYAAGADKPDAATNHRNGKSGKTVRTDDDPLRIEMPRDRQGDFEPKLIGKHERYFTGFDDKIIAMYARGMTVREIQGFLSEDWAAKRELGFVDPMVQAATGPCSTHLELRRYPHASDDRLDQSPRRNEETYGFSASKTRHHQALQPSQNQTTSPRSRRMESSEVD